MFNQNNANGNNLFPLFNVQLDNESDIKLTEDQYEVYVNDRFVGHKALKNQGEALSDIDDFLKYQGMNEFSSSLDGDHYTIETNGKDQEITNALSVYFNNR